jgi:hypothetical protein
MCAGILVALATAPSALADTTQSTNWAGYSAHGSGVSYRSVQGSWVQPSATCVRGTPTYSSYWVGIGGYTSTSQALEQVGTEVDCGSFGKVSTSAWYELVPAPSMPVRLTVRPGDVMQAAVSVSGRSVTVTLNDVTRGQGFRKTVRASALDLSSAEWIVEAPSECISANSCQTLPLANFGSATFSSASTQTVSGRVGTIANSAWQTTKINLRPASRRFIVNTSSGPAIGIASPGGLVSGGAGFKVLYQQLLVPGGNIFGIRAGTARAGHIVHPTR